MTSKKLLNHLKRLNAKQKGEGHPRYKHIRLSRRVYEMYYGDPEDSFPGEFQGLTFNQ